DPVPATTVPPCDDPFRFKGTKGAEHSLLRAPGGAAERLGHLVAAAGAPSLPAQRQQTHHLALVGKRPLITGHPVALGGDLGPAQTRCGSWSAGCAVTPGPARGRRQSPWRPRGGWPRPERSAAWAQASLGLVANLPPIASEPVDPVEVMEGFLLSRRFARPRN